MTNGFSHKIWNHRLGKMVRVVSRLLDEKHLEGLACVRDGSGILVPIAIGTRYSGQPDPSCIMVPRGARHHWNFSTKNPDFKSRGFSNHSSILLFLHHPVMVSAHFKYIYSRCKVVYWQCEAALLLHLQVYCFT